MNQGQIGKEEVLEWLSSYSFVEQKESRLYFAETHIDEEESGEEQELFDSK